MLDRLACLALVLAVPIAGCSAVVSPDTNRLGAGTDSGLGTTGDSGMIPGTDSGRIPGVDSGVTCASGQLVCGGTCVMPATDPLHCGNCTTACSTGQSCVSGVCTGGSGVVFGNPNDCGASHAVCDALQVCIAGACVCRSPYTNVGGVCIDLGSDPNNCGRPGNVCPNRCAGGVCISGTCPRPSTSCDGACVDTRRDPGNCGGCGNVCDGTQICAGQCRDVIVPTGCTSCPCDACNGGSQCCTYPGLSTPVCIDGVDFCPAA